MQQELVTQAMIEELEHAEQKIERAMKSAFYEVGIELRHINSRRLYVLRCPTWEDYLLQRWEMTRQRANQLITAAEAVMSLTTKLRLVDEMSTTVDKMSTKTDLVYILPTRETHVRPLLKLDDADHRADVWRRVLDSTNGSGITAQLVAAEVERKIAELNKAWITLQEWNELSFDDQLRALTRRGDKTFNETNENIEWAMWSWNPVTGCQFGCSYCYAHDIANRFYPHKFEPTFHPDRLTAPQNNPAGRPRWTGDIGYRGVFVGSMTDLFGPWVPQEWIDATLDSTRKAPQWNFLFLTKNPMRMVDIDWPENAWVGTTVDRQSRVDTAQEAFASIDASVKFVSCEPLLESVQFTRLDLFDWLIIGGQSKTSQVPELQPEWAWVEQLLGQARRCNCMTYFKTNLTVRPREYPE